MASALAALFGLGMLTSDGDACVVRDEAPRAVVLGSISRCRRAVLQERISKL